MSKVCECGEPLEWVQLASNRWHPVDPGVRVRVVTEDGQLVVGRRSHFESCKAEQFQRRGQAQAGLFEREEARRLEEHRERVQKATEALYAAKWTGCAFTNASRFLGRCYEQLQARQSLEAKKLEALRVLEEELAPKPVPAVPSLGRGRAS